jgi:hypothetical protein
MSETVRHPSGGHVKHAGSTIMKTTSMRRGPWIRLAPAAAWLLAGPCIPADAQPVTQRSLSNSYIWNMTGQEVNGFQIAFTGFSPDSVGEINLTDYPKATVTDMQGGLGAVIDWRGGTTPPGGVSLFGNELLGDATPVDVEIWWINDDEPVGIIDVGYQSWSGFVGNPPVWVDIFVYYETGDPNQAPISIERRINTTEDEITLNDLLVTGDLWLTAKKVDDQPVLIEPGGQITFDFPWEGQPYVNFVMMYDVTDQDGRLIATFLNAVTVVDEQPCYADFTGDGVLDLFDFLGYVNAFNAGEGGADCDGNGVLDLFDFLCFVNAFNAGC